MDPKPGTAQEAEKPDEADESGDSTATGGRLPRHPEPTRYGDWEISGRCVDF